MNILITGGLGYIGSHSFVELSKKHSCIIIDDLSNSDVWVLKKLEKLTWRKIDFYEWKIWDKKLLEKIFLAKNIDAVIHFAWFKAVWESCQNPFKYMENNVGESLVLFSVMEKFWVKKIVFSSSATVYDSKNNLPYTEEQNLATTNPYWETKLLLEKILKNYAIFWGWQVVALRYFNPIWAHESWLIGEKPSWIPNNLLPYVMDVAIGKRQKVWVFWADYDTPDWTWVRDYIHIVDLALAYEKAVEFLQQQNENIFEAINIWTWVWTSVLEIIDFSTQASWKKIAYEILPRREGDIAICYCNPEKSKKLLNWKAEKSVSQAVQDSRNFIKTQSWENKS